MRWTVRVGGIVTAGYLAIVLVALLIGVVIDVREAAKGYPGGAVFAGVPALLLTSPSSFFVAIPMLDKLGWTPDSATGWVARVEYPNAIFLALSVAIGAILNLLTGWTLLLGVAWIVRRVAKASR